MTLGVCVWAPSILRDRLSLVFIVLAGLAGSQASVVYLSPLPILPSLGLQVYTTTPGFLGGLWGSKLRSFCLQML